MRVNFQGEHLINSQVLTRYFILDFHFYTNIGKGTDKYRGKVPEHECEKQHLESSSDDFTPSIQIRVSRTNTRKGNGFCVEVWAM
jgi:hypothetical protein